MQHRIRPKSNTIYKIHQNYVDNTHIEINYILIFNLIDEYVLCIAVEISIVVNN